MLKGSVVHVGYLIMKVSPDFSEFIYIFTWADLRWHTSEILLFYSVEEETSGPEPPVDPYGPMVSGIYLDFSSCTSFIIDH